MKKIRLSGKGHYVAFVDDCDYKTLSAYTWRPFKAGNNVYAGRFVKNTEGKLEAILMHRVIMNAPEGLDVDHKDGNGLRNTRDNLRLATRSQNLANTSKYYTNNTTSRFKGVRLRKDGKYSAQIKIMGQYIHLGLHKRATDAARSYDRAARRYFGEFARPNFPDTIAA